MVTPNGEKKLERKEGGDSWKVAFQIRRGKDAPCEKTVKESGSTFSSIPELK